MSFGPKQNTQEINNFKKINTVSMPQPDNETSLKIINEKPKNLEDSKNKKVFFKDQNTIISVEINSIDAFLFRKIYCFERGNRRN